MFKYIAVTVCYDRKTEIEDILNFQSLKLSTLWSNQNFRIKT